MRCLRTHDAIMTAFQWRTIWKDNRMSIAPDTFVRLVTDPKRSGVVQPGEKTTAGMRMVPVQFGNGTVSWLLADNLEPVPEAPPDLAECFADGRFVAPDWLRRVLTRIRVTGRLSDVVYSMEATETDFYAYQFKPVLKLLNSPTDALLIADEVGLGKTIEAGLIWTELRARLECNRLLVLCPKTLCEKWRDELDRRFGVDARIVGAPELLAFMKKHNRIGRGFAAVASMQSLRPPSGWEREDETGTSRRGDSPRRRLAEFLKDEADGEPLIDLPVVDEVHHMRNPSTMLYRLGELVNAVSTYRIFLSATPIHLRSRDLNSLLRLIDPDTFEYESTLDDLIHANEPIIEARDMLMRSSATREQIIECIDDARIGVLANSKALELVRKDLVEGSLDAATRAEVASRLESVNQMANYLNRTRRRDVEELKVVREPQVVVLPMREEERAFYKAVTKEVADYVKQQEVNAGFLLPTQQRLLTSSLTAASAYWMGCGENGSDEIEETDGDLESNDSDDRPLVARLKVLARNLGMTASLEKNDTKFKTLTDQLDQFFKDEKVIVFSSFIPTLRYLQRRLKESGIGCELLHGSIHEPRHTVLERFRNRPDVRILLSSEVGSEGIDLQFCRTVVNYDLPWNPMRLEQRIGRVDRLGQESPKVSVLNLVYAGTIDAEICCRLYVRLKLSERALGEFEPVLGEPIREMGQKLLDPKLSEEQKKDVIDQTAQAIENRRLQEDELEQEAGALIRHGDYILEKIKRRHERHQWLNGDDILVYIKDRLDRRFPGCRIEASPTGSDTYRIVLSQAALSELASFIKGQGGQGTTRLIHNDAHQRYRFTSSVARQWENKVEQISRLHILARFVGELDKDDEDSHEVHPVAASIPCDRLKFGCKPGIYVIGIGRWEVPVTGNRASGMTHLTYVGAGLDESELLPSEGAETMAGAVAAHGRPLPNFAHDARLPAAARLLRERVLPEMQRLNDELYARTRADIQDRAAIRERALRRHRDKKRDELQRQRDSHQSNAEREKNSDNERRFQQLSALSRATDGRLRKLEDNFALQLRQIEDQRTFQPECSDVTYLLIEVTGSKTGGQNLC
jgi:SNF2 family DNA or RNA helicase